MSFISYADFALPGSALLHWWKHLYIWSFQTGAVNLDGVIRLPGKLPDLVISSLFGHLLSSYFYMLFGLAVAFVSFYLFAKYFLEIRSRLIVVLSAAAFTLNPVYLSNFAKLGVVIGSAALPLSLFLIKRWFQTGKFWYLALLILPLNLSLFHPFTFLVNAGIGFVYFIVLSFRNKRFTKRNRIKYATFVFLAFLLNAYFLLPALQVGTVDKAAIVSDLSYIPITYHSIVEVASTRTIFSALTFDRSAFIDFSLYGFGYAPFYLLGVLGLYILPLAIYLAVSKRLTRRKKLILMVATTGLLVFLLLSTGTFLHVDAFISFLISLPGGWAFRSPLKWQLYLPFFLITIFSLVVAEVRWRRRLLLLLFTASLILANGYLVLQISDKLLEPKSPVYARQLQNLDLNNKRILFLSSNDCNTFANDNPNLFAEINHDLLSQNVQLKRAEYEQIRSINFLDFDYLIACKVPATHIRNSGYEKISDFGFSSLALYRNQHAAKAFSTLPYLFRIQPQADIVDKRDFAVNYLHQGFGFVAGNEPDTRGITNVFELISPRNLRPGEISKKVGTDGQQGTVILRPGRGQIYYKSENSQIQLSATPSKGYQGPIASDHPVPIIGKYKLTWFDPTFTAANILPNPSFEQGLWQSRVGDCDARDDNPKLKMASDETTSTDGKRSLRLEAARHIACTRSSIVSLKDNSPILLSFDYQSPNSMRAGYYVGFEGSDQFYSERLPVPTKDWNQFSRVVRVPKGAKSLFLIFYSYPDLGTGQFAITRYDNIKIVPVPDIGKKVYAVQNENYPNVAPKVDYQLQNPTYKRLRVIGATHPFYLLMNETYHPRWKLVTNKRTGFRFTTPAVGKHVKANGDINAWYIDPAKECTNNPSCFKRPDGSYDIEMVAEFSPQKWFYLGGIISGFTLASCLGYLAFDWRRRRKRKSSERHL